MKKTSIKKIAIWWILLMILESIFTLLISKNWNLQWSVNIILNSFIIAQIFTLLTSLGKEKFNKWITAILLFVLGVLFATQAVFYKIFKVYFSLYDLALQDQLNSFISETIMFLIRYSPYIFCFLSPFILFLIFQKKLTIPKNKASTSFLLLLTIISSIVIRESFITFNKEKNYSTYDLIHNVNNMSLHIKKLGVLNSYTIEGKRMLFGFTPKKIKVVTIPKKEEEVHYEENVLDLKLKDGGNSSINEINHYIKEDSPTLKNQYTGMFEGYNLVYITAESFSEVGIREDLTPTLYRLTHTGFLFENFYTPNNLSTIGGEFQSLTGLYPDYSILKKWREGSNSYPYGIANVFRSLGYDTYAYHNNSYVFQDRNNYIASQGFTNFLACYNGLEKRINCGRWPQSDVEMIDTTIDDYIHNEKPFLAYYMTVSGHFAYTFDGNSIASKNRELVENLNMRESSEAYLATQIELDRALEHLISALEKENKLDKTVFVLMADHYPYELEIDAINELSTYARNDIEINHNALILWNSELETRRITKPCMSADVLPTVYNLFGVDYDSRLFTGRDILSTDFGVAVLSDRSWITKEGIYNASSGEFTKKEEVEEDYVNQVNQLINSRLNIARLLIETDYYKTLIP